MICVTQRVAFIHAEWFTCTSVSAQEYGHEFVGPEQGFVI